MVGLEMPRMLRPAWCPHSEKLESSGRCQGESCWDNILEGSVLRTRSEGVWGVQRCLTAVTGSLREREPCAFSVHLPAPVGLHSWSQGQAHWQQVFAGEIDPRGVL